MFRPENAQSLVGIGFTLLVCWLLSEDKARFPWRLAIGAILVQVALVLLLFATPGAQAAVQAVNDGVDGLASATAQGTQFVFGYMGGGTQPYSVDNPQALFVFAFQVLPLILVISALSALLWHWQILKWITRGFGFIFQKTMGLGGASALAVAANIFLGMIESPIVIRAYLDKLTKSELFLMMVVGLATVAGSTMVAYATILKHVLPNAAAHVLVASIISAPAGVLLARIMVPEKKGVGGAYADYASLLKYDSAIDAISKGTMDGLTVVLNISAILIVFVALFGKDLVRSFERVLRLLLRMTGASVGDNILSEINAVRQRENYASTEASRYLKVLKPTAASVAAPVPAVSAAGPSPVAATSAAPVAKP